jgi:hypothetical protein
MNKSAKVVLGRVLIKIAIGGSDLTNVRFSNRPFGVVCHERRREYRRCATVRKMKEGPSGSAIRC